MKIRLLDFLNNEHFVDVPDDTDEITIDVISGDMILTSPFRYDTSDTRIMDYTGGNFNLHKNDFHILDEVKSTSEFIYIMYDYDE